jgi:hypothetical protein
MSIVVLYIHDIIEDAGFIVTNMEKTPMWGLPVEIVVARK